jgi:5-methylcytosine-specific restriction endonuclease McrBC regulatory subunit McrC
LFRNIENPKITPDILVKATGSPQDFVLVCDTKYNRKAKTSDDDWYQIISYTLALKVPIGVLIYPAEAPQEPVEYQIGDHTIWVYYFPLQAPKTQEEHLIQFLRQLASEAKPGNA